MSALIRKFAQAVCKKLGVEPEFVEIVWETKEVELNAKTIDCIWNGMTIDADRLQNMSISQPYVKNMQVIVIKSENASKYTDTASLSGKSIAAEAEDQRVKVRPGKCRSFQGNDRLRCKADGRSARSEGRYL